jgi:hypothetical protein
VFETHGTIFHGKRGLEVHDRLPHLDLDEIFWDREAKTFCLQADPQVRNAALAEFIARRAWVVEGVYVRQWVLPSFTPPDAIVALRPAVWVRDWHYSTRWLQRTLGLSPRKQNKRERSKGCGSCARTTTAMTVSISRKLGRSLPVLVSR